MKTLAIILCLFTFPLLGQDCKYWYPFEKEVTHGLSNLLGFKDCHGKIMLKPIHTSPLTQARKFEKIIALSEYKEEGRSNNFYLNKAGKKFGRDSLYMFDLSYDTEQEGFIRFSIGKYLDSIGLFNEHGKVLIKPIYNALSKVNNGLLFAKIGAKQQHESHGGGCDHWTFEGGKNQLLNTSGELLIDNLTDDDIRSMDLYSIKISDKIISETNRCHFLGSNGRYYSFINFEDEFYSFLQADFLPAKNIKIKDYLFVTLKNSSSKIKDKINNLKKKIEISSKHIYKSYYDYIDLEDKKTYRAMANYINNNNEVNTEKFPLFNFSQNGLSLSFIRTENGYKVYEYQFK